MRRRRGANAYLKLWRSCHEDRSLTLATSVIVCAHNEERTLPGCLHSLLAQTRLPDEIVVVNNASTDATGDVARRVGNVRVVDEPRKGLVTARETGRAEARGNLLVYIDADCRAPVKWLERIERHFARDSELVALTGPYRFTTGTGGAVRSFVPTTTRSRPRRRCW
jgi:glycosyltransferase involved in cell wall biosynthesis